MCGIAGFISTKNILPNAQRSLGRMIGSLYHRGPDECGFLYDKKCAMGMSRLSIIDLKSGSQPIHNEDKSLWIVFNGEIFNYPELGAELKSKGHQFYTSSDTETILHCYEEYGLDFVEHLNGQFAIAIWDTKKQRLILARDRVGIRPLFYAHKGEKIIFASEMKAIFAEGSIRPQITEKGLADIFTFWVNIPPQTIFKNIFELPPGHIMITDGKTLNIKRYWSYTFPENGEFTEKPEKVLKEELRTLLYDAVSIRLRADVPVASYLSGGLDSSIISSLVKKYHNNDLLTFSVTFKDDKYDERLYQNKISRKIGTRHFSIDVGDSDIANAFSDVIWFSEKPLMRTAPAPLYALSSLVRNTNIKVVLTGEGADEIFGGYNIFKEDKVRRFWARQPNSRCRPLLFYRLYPYVLKPGGALNAFWQAFFKKHLTETENQYYSHLLRWENTSHIRLLFNNRIKNAFDFSEQQERLDRYLKPEQMKRWHPLNRAQYIEAALFMNGYLLSSQGDRMMMGHSVEGRFPFLDHRIIEFASHLNPDLKIRVLNEKYFLKNVYDDMLPDEIVNRKKQPYRAPIASVFLTPKTPTLISDLLSEKMIKKYGYFNSIAVERLKKKIVNSSAKVSEREEMALVACVSTQLLHHHFVENFNEQTFTLPEKKNVVKLF